MRGVNPNPVDDAAPAGAAAHPQSRSAIGECVRREVAAYFRALDGHDASGLYDLVLSEVEPPLIEEVMRQARGNLTRAAVMLSLNRATLRKLLRKYGLEK
jgi:Fis family transcriptional regulator